MHAKHLAVIKQAKDGCFCILLKIIPLLNDLFESLNKKQYFKDCDAAANGA